MATSLWLEETELRLGLPGGAGKNSGGKRGVVPETTVDLKLHLQTPAAAKKEAAPPPVAAAEKVKRPAEGDGGHEKQPAPKAQVVGWPPVRSFRKNIFSVRPEKTVSVTSKEDGEKSSGGGGGGGGGGGASFVKVSMDGAPYLRKVDLKMYRGYPDLFMALQKMFISFGNYGCDGILSGRDFMNEKKVKDAVNGSQFVPTYEDKDGDWMLVGDVPWEMFVNSCKRLRIMKGSDAIGLAPRAMEKCKNLS